MENLKNAAHANERHFFFYHNFIKIKLAMLITLLP